MLAPHSPTAFFCVCAASAAAALLTAGDAGFASVGLSYQPLFSAAPAVPGGGAEVAPASAWLAILAACAGMGVAARQARLG